MTEPRYLMTYRYMNTHAGTEEWKINRVVCQTPTKRRTEDKANRIVNEANCMSVLQVSNKADCLDVFIPKDMEKKASMTLAQLF